MRRLLLAEDDTVTRNLLTRLASQWGYDVTAASTGDEALTILESENAPRLAVLDWHMPGCDGIEICRRLAKRPQGAPFIHTILITTATESDRLAQALDNGANDFLTKPLIPNEFKSRLGVGRRILGYNDELNKKNGQLRKYATELETLAASRAKRLLHADRMATLGLLTAGIAHEVNNPATFISGNAQTIRQFWHDVAPLLTGRLGELRDEERRKVEFVLDELPKALDGILGGVKRISSIVRGLKAYSHQGKGDKQPCEVSQFIQNAVGLCGYDLNKRQIAVKVSAGDDLPPVHGNSQQLEQVIVNLAVNAAQAMEGSPVRQLTIGASSHGSQVRIAIEDTGPGIPTDLRERIWQPFFTTKAPGDGTGLGLSICHDIVKAHDGDVAIEDGPEGGARFIVSLPAIRRSNT